MRLTAVNSFAPSVLVVALFSACTTDDANIPFSAVTDIRETQDGQLLVAGYSSPDIDVLESGFIEMLEPDADLDDFTSRVRAAEVPEETGLPPIWGVTECEPGQFVAVIGNWLPFTAVHGPDWVVESLPARWALVGVAGSSCDDVIAVGRKEDEDSGEVVGVIAQFDGDEWTEMDIPEGTPSLVEIWRGALGTFAVGDEGTILSLTDEGWVNMDSPTDQNLRAVWGGTERLFAVGGAADGDYVVLEFDGEEWAEVASGDGTLLAIHGVADDDVYAVGGASDPSSGARSCNVLHFDGAEWATVGCSYAGVFWDVWELSDGRALAGGDDATLIDVSE